MEHQMGTTGSDGSKEETRGRASAIDELKFTFHEPPGAGGFVFSQDPGRRDLLELFFQVAGKLDWGERLADRHFAFRVSNVAGEDGVIDTKGADVNCLGTVGADAAIGRHVDAF